MQFSRPDEALEYLKSHHFHSWEGRYDIHQYWVESQIQLGDKALAAGDAKTALTHYQASLEYPENLEVAELSKTINAREWYKVGQAYATLGNKGQAREYFRKVVAQEQDMEEDSAYRYYLALAQQQLGQKAQATGTLEGLLAAVNAGRKPVVQVDDGEPNFDPRRNPRAVDDYKRALALEGLGRLDEARQCREQAEQLDPIVALRAFSPPRAGW